MSVAIRQLHYFVAVARSGSFAEACSQLHLSQPALSLSQMEEMGAECRPLSGPVITRELGVITRKRQPLSAATQAMLEVIARWADPSEAPTHSASS
jgi:DNA-binding transcriptional LysR family regulator